MNSGERHLSRRALLGVGLGMALGGGAAGQYVTQTNDLPHSATSIGWITESFEPFYISRGPQSGQGVVDRIIDLLQVDLPLYQHSRRLLPILRLRRALVDQEQIACLSFLKDPSLQAYAQYSVPTLLIPPQELTVRQSTWRSRLQGKPQMSLKTALSQGLQLGLAEGRNYGDQLAPMLAAHAKAKGELVIRGGNHYLDLARMVAVGRIEATLGYRAELNFLLTQDAELQEQLVSIPILENSRFLYAYAVLPKSSWGDAFREALNESLFKLRPTAAYRRAITDWFGEPPGFADEYEHRFIQSKG